MNLLSPPRIPADSALVAALFAVDPAGTGGVALRASAGPLRDAWLALLRELLPAEAPWRRVPLGIADERLLGGLDLGATLQTGRAVAQRGVLAEADGGVLLLAMAERLPAGTAARIAAVLDAGEVVVERDGIGSRRAARFGVVALDEGVADDERLPAALLDRLAFPLLLDDAQARAAARSGDAAGDGGGVERVSDNADDSGAATPCSAAEVRAARALLPRVTASDEVLQALCATALMLGVASLRASVQALRAACALAALAGRDAVDDADAALAARLVLAPRATQLPAAPPQQGDEAADAAADPPDDRADEPEPEVDPDPEPEAAEPPESSSDLDQPPPSDARDPNDGASAQLEEGVLEAAVAAIPAGLLAALKLGQGSQARSVAAGRSGAVQTGRLRGRPNGVRAGEPRAGARLNLLETLRAAAPWQTLRRRDMAAPIVSTASGRSRPPTPAVLVRRDDFRISRFKQRSVTTTLFVVDASGSAALARLAEAKGAVELLLADCYVRRDQVAVLAFRGQTAELLLPPTRSLVRAKRSLAGLPGGGGTPLAAGIDAAVALADSVRRHGETPIVVLLTDGRGNIARNGAPGRAQAAEDATQAARQLRAAGFSALLIDTSAQPHPAAEALAREMGATYLPLPYAGAAGVSQAVQAVQAVRAVQLGTSAR